MALEVETEAATTSPARQRRRARMEGQADACLLRRRFPGVCHSPRRRRRRCPSEGPQLGTSWRGRDVSARRPTRQHPIRSRLLSRKPRNQRNASRGRRIDRRGAEGHRVLLIPSDRRRLAFHLAGGSAGTPLARIFLPDPLAGRWYSGFIRQARLQK